MNLSLSRTEIAKNYTKGKLSINDEFFCYTLEDADRKLEDGGIKIAGATAIPRGTYNVIIDYSQRFKRNMPHITDVPDFVGVRIHKGNTTVDTEGCLLLGMEECSGDFIGQSKIAFDTFYPKLEAALNIDEEVTIEIS